ncbi:RNA-directed DNA polymerase from mobile element jockey [Trichonephila clavipes]|nr:RNA-directed DNA polymerase from mobile element jockey [Trichonephila clavipes]
MAYSDFEKKEAFKDTLGVTFQENVEPYCDDKIEEVKNVVCNYFDNFTTLTPPLTSPNEVRGIIKKLQNRKAAGYKIGSHNGELQLTLTSLKQSYSENGESLTPPPFQLTLFDNNIQWVSVVRYLGLHIDSRLTYKKHIDYLSEKFCGRINLAISLVGRNSPLSLENKVILYKQVLRPIITYASPVLGAAAATHMKKIQVKQNKILRLITNAPWYVRNDVIHYDLHMEPISSYITKLARNVFRSIENHDNPIIRAQTMFTHPHPKLKYAYATAKWQIPLTHKSP